MASTEYDPITGHRIDHNKHTADGSLLIEQIRENQMWGDIRRLARTNPTLQDAVDRVIMTYRLIKVNK
jgi:hypothetical protein